MKALKIQENNEMDSVLHHQCIRAVQPVQVDGYLDENVWQEAQPLQLFSTDGKEKPVRPTVARMACDESYLYVAFECTDPDVWCTYTGRDEPLFKEENVEVFVLPEQDVYYEFECNARGALFDARFPRGEERTRRHWAWNAQDLQVGVSVQGTIGTEPGSSMTDSGWTAEMALPFAAMRVPASGESWKINLCRIERWGRTKGECEMTCWAPTYDEGFHAVERYGTVTFP